MRYDMTKAELVVVVYEQRKELDHLRAQLRRLSRPWALRLADWWSDECRRLAGRWQGRAGM